MMSKFIVALYNLIGRRRHNDDIEAVPQLAEKQRVIFYCLNISIYLLFFFKVLIETDVSISNKLNLTSVKYIWVAS